MARLVPIGYAYGAADVALALSLLEASGIPAVAQGRRFGEMAWSHATAMQGSALLVPDAAADEALEVLDGFRPMRRRPGAAMVIFYVFAAFWAVIPPPPAGYHALSRTVPAPTRSA